MKLANIRLLQEPSNSFIYYKETKPFSSWHYHAEYELVLITNGCGRRVVGDHIDRFENNDLVLLGSNTPHEWLCDPEYYQEPDNFKGVGIVVQFVHDFLGDKFMDIPENISLKAFLALSSRGIVIEGETKNRIISLMLRMNGESDRERLYTLFSIFRIFSSTSEVRVLASPSYIESMRLNIDEPMQKALRYILQNFQKNITIKELLEETNMSNTSFCAAFKHAHRMTFKEYLLNIRVGYACKMLTEDSHNISEIAYISGFENISNFNRQFKKIKGITPTQYQDKIHQRNESVLVP